MIYKYGQKIKYSISEKLTDNGWKPIILTGYVLRDDGGEYIWISDTQEELENRQGAVIDRKSIIK